MLCCYVPPAYTPDMAFPPPHDSPMDAATMGGKTRTRTRMRNQNKNSPRRSEIDYDQSLLRFLHQFHPFTLGFYEFHHDCSTMQEDVIDRVPINPRESEQIFFFARSPFLLAGPVVVGPVSWSHGGRRADDILLKDANN